MFTTSACVTESTSSQASLVNTRHNWVGTDCFFYLRFFTVFFICGNWLFSLSALRIIPSMWHSDAWYGRMRQRSLKGILNRNQLFEVRLWNRASKKSLLFLPPLVHVKVKQNRQMFTRTAFTAKLDVGTIVFLLRQWAGERNLFCLGRVC